jgi:hypothetical protein
MDLNVPVHLYVRCESSRALYGAKIGFSAIFVLKGLACSGLLGVADQVSKGR